MAEPYPDGDPAAGYQVPDSRMTGSWAVGQLVLAETAVQPPAISAVAIVNGAISTPLDSAHRVLVLSEDVAGGWTAPLPSGGDASAQVYWSSLDLLPPEAGGPFALSIPAAWLALGPLDTLALEAGDDPITVTLRSWGSDGVAYSAVQGRLPA
jgi:hypothetical protein